MDEAKLMELVKKAGAIVCEDGFAMTNRQFAEFARLVAARDARVKVETLREAADKWKRQMIHETAREELRRMADAIEKGQS